MNYYEYIYYKLYKLSEAAPSRWWSEWKALALLGLLWIFVLISSLFYYTYLTGNILRLSKINVGVTIFALVIIPNYLIFMREERWKKIILEFDKLPSRKNKAGSIVIFLLILFIILNMVCSFILADRKARREHIGRYSNKESKF